MDQNDVLNDVLDEWEELLEQNVQADIDAFIEKHTNRLGETNVEEFRRKAVALAKMNNRLAVLQDTDDLPPDTSRPNMGRGELSYLKRGYEPLGGYKLVERLGEGGFGEVWKATDSQGFSVAIKFVQLGGKFGDKELRSLDVIKDVRHPHLLTIFGTRQLDDVLVIAMELADRTLLARQEEAVKEGYDGIPRDELLEYMAEAAKGIDFLNDPGSSSRPRIQHRDIKPHNLLLSGNSVKIADYGLAQALTFNVADSTGSTPAFAAPEFFEGNTTSRSDQYSLAITYCFLRSGRAPFQGSVVELMEAHRNHEPDLSMLPPEERPAVARALSKKSKDRWLSCTAFVDALKSAVAEPSSSTSGGFADVVRTLNELPTKNKVIAGAAASSLLLLQLLFSLFGGNGTGDNSGDGTPPQRSGTATATDDAQNSLTLAVLDFANHSQDPALEGYRLGFRDMLTTELSKLSSIKILDRSRLEALLKEHDLAKTDFIDPQTAVRLRQGISAQAMLSGSYLISGDNIRVDVQLVSVETGEVMQADAVEGKKSDMFGLQKALAAKVLGGLDVTPTTAEQEALNQPQTREFEAFRLYSESQLAQLRGNQKEAKARLREALAKDQDFELASRALDRLESDALVRMTQAEQDRARSSGEIGQTLLEHQQNHQRIVEAEKRDPEYFASLLVLSAHAGLWGDSEKERKLLLTFWKRFEEAVPPSECPKFSQALKKLVAKEGEFFQTNVDSGKYGMLVLTKPEDMYLKSDLRGTLQWPRWSTMWPFDDSLRMAFQNAQRAKSGKFPVKIEADWFDNRLPLYPHDYLEKVIKDIYEARRKDATRYNDALETLASVVGYYGRIENKPASFETDGDVEYLHHALLSRLKDLQPEQMQSGFLRDLLPTLEVLAQTDTDPDLRKDANSLLVRFVRQLRINEGGEVSESAKQGPLKFCELQLSGSPIVVVWQVASIGGFDPAQNRIEKHIRESLADAVRSMPEQTHFNFQWAGHVNKDKVLSAFTAPQPATNETKKKGLDWLYQKAPRALDESLPVGEVIERLANELDEKGVVILIVLDDDIQIPQSTIDFVHRGRSIPRFYVVARKKKTSFAKIVAASKGAGVSLKAEGGFTGTDKVVVEKWDVADVETQPKPKTSAVVPFEPRRLSIDDFQLTERVADAEVRKHLESKIREHLGRFDPTTTSTPRYFASVALLAQIAGRIGHRPLEDALTRKWWNEVKPFAVASKAVAYEVARKESRRREEIAEPEPLLFELKNLLRKESDDLWSKPRISELFDLPKPKRAPNSEPYIWASPYFWLRGICEYREEMGSPISEQVLRYHLDAGPEFNTLFISSASISWMDGAVRYYGGAQSERRGTALRLADLAIQVCESIPITDKKKQKWLVEGVERLRMSKAKISQESLMREDWVTPEEYAPRRPWNGFEQRGTTFPLFGREIKASEGVVVVMDLSGIDAGERSQTLNGLRLAVNESGQDVEMRVVVVGREIVVWPERAATSSLDDKGRKTLLDWLEQLDQGGLHSSSSTRGKLASAIKEAHVVRGAAGTPPSSILVICQESDLEDFNPDQLARDIPIHTFAIPRLGGSGWSGQKAQIEKMRILAEKAKATFTVVSDDWTWLYLGE